MIVCTNKKSIINKLSRHYFEINLSKDKEESNISLGIAKLYSDIGVLPIIIVKDVEDMLYVKERVEQDTSLNVIFIYSDDSIDEIFKDDDVFKKVL